MSLKVPTVILPVLLLLSLSLNFFLGSKILQPQNEYLVQSVIDGDSFTLSDGQKVRLNGVDAPEKGLCGSDEAKNRLTELIQGEKVRLEWSITDTFNRKIALVYMGNTLVNEKMLEEGWGRNKSGYGDKLSLLKDAHHRGLAQRKGIFSSLCRIEQPEKDNCLIKGNINDDNQKFYFFPGCREYNQVIVEKDLGEQWFCSEKEALAAGFSKPANCPEKYKIID